MRRRRTLAVLGSAIVAVAAIVAVVLTSVVQVPEFASLQDVPQTGTVVYTRDDDERSRPIVLVDLATGEASVVPLGGENEVQGWDAEGNLVVVEWLGSSQRRLVIDPQTGEVLSRGIAAEDFGDDAVADPIWPEHRDGRVVLVDQRGEVVASFPAPDSYDVTTASRLGEDRIVLVDELGRVGVLSTGGDAAPVLVADDAVPWAQVLGRP